MKSTTMKVRLFAASAVLSTLAGTTGLATSQIKAEIQAEPVVETVALDSAAGSEIESEAVAQGASIAVPTTGSAAFFKTFINILAALAAALGIDLS